MDNNKFDSRIAVGSSLSRSNSMLPESSTQIANRIEDGAAGWHGFSGISSRNATKRLSGQSSEAAASKPCVQEGASPCENACCDSFVQSKSVCGLNQCNFKNFIKRKEVSMVLFYDPCKSDCRYSKHQITRAAKITDRPDHAYAAVNCSLDKKICDEEKVTSLPFFKLYSRGVTVGSYKDFLTMDSKTLKKFVEASPVPEKKPRNSSCL